MSTPYNDRKSKRGRESFQVNNLVYGKVPPQAIELEEAILGAIMLERGAMDIVGEIMKPASFYVQNHVIIFSAMLNMAARYTPIDMLTVTEELRASGQLEVIGGPYTIIKLTNKVVSSANIEAHARIVQQKFLQRELIRISAETISAAYEDTTDVFDLLDTTEAQLFDITSRHLKADVKGIKPLFDRELNALVHRIDKNEDITGVPSGFKALDRVTYGWQPTDLIIIAARPSVGKTAFALNLARNAALNSYRSTGAAVFSLEMSSGQILQRLISAESEVPLDLIKRGKMKNEELNILVSTCNRTIREALIFIDDTPALNIFELRAKCRRLVHNHGVGVIIVDYLQLMTGNSEGRTNREQEISKISRDLKALAKELNVPVIALSQLSREVEKRSGNTPQLSDLRESGAIEQDADMVMFLYRADYQKEAAEVDPSIAGDVNIKIAKHRNGSLETIALKADLTIQKFFDIKPPFSQPSPSGFIPMHQAISKFQLETPPPIVDPEDELPF